MAGKILSARCTAAEFLRQLKLLRAPEDVPQVARYFSSNDNPFAAGNQILGVKIGKVFPLARQFAETPLEEVEKLLDDAHYEARMGAVSIMDFQARARTVAPDVRKSLFELYVRRHGRINNWDLVDRAAPWVVGAYLADKPREPLTRFAQSRNPWERRTAIVSTWFFIRAGDVGDTFRIAALLAKDKHELVQKAVGSWLREAGKREPRLLLHFLDRHHTRMPSPMLRYALEKLDKDTQLRYLAADRA